MKKTAWNTLRAYALMTLGSILYALAFAWCFDPGHIGLGGVTGLAQIVNRFLPVLPVGVAVMLLNIPLFLAGCKLLGGGVLVRSLYAMLCSAVGIDLLTQMFAFRPMEPILASIVGGVLMGGGLGLVFLQSSTTGGTDLLARLLKLRFGWLPMGKLLMCIDLVVIVLVAAAFRSLESGLYGVIGLYISSLVMDKMLYGLDKAKVAYIISDQSGDIARAIARELERGVTLLEGRGGWSGKRREVLMCAFKQRQIVELKALVKERDPDAFLIVCDAHEVLGDGFRAYQKDDI